jgi:hypothetical protein
MKEQDKLEDRLKKLESKEGLTSEIDRYLEVKRAEIRQEFEDLSKELRKAE